MRFGSVCSGIEAASVAWHPLGWEAAWLSEIEPFPCAVLKHHYPDVPNHGDMTLLPEKILSGEVEAPDLFCGGTPCQAFSVAGLRNSLDDARGNLSLTFVGIANAIDHVRSVRRDAPAIIFWENVPGVLNTKDNAFGCFLGALAGENDPLLPPGDKWSNAGCVYGPQRTVAWRVLDAQYFGVAQRRRRVFVIASARDDLDPAKVLFEFEGVRRDTAPSRKEGQRATTSPEDSPRVSSEGLLGRGDCGVDLSGPLSARDYKDAGTDGMNKNSAKMVPVMQELVGALDTQCGGNKMSHQTIASGHLLPVKSFYESSLAQYREDNVSGTIKASGGVAGGGSETFLAHPVAVYENHPADSRIKDMGEVCSTVTSRWGTGGGNMPIVSQPIPIHDQATRHAGRNGEKTMGKGNGLGIGQEGDPMNTLTKGDRHAVAQPIAFNIAPGKGDLKDDIHVTDAHISKTIDASGSNPAMHQGGAAIVQPIAFEPGKLKRLGYGDAEPGISPALRAQAGDNQVAVAQPIAMRESGQGYWMEDDKAGTLRAEGENRPSRPSHVIAQPIAFHPTQDPISSTDGTTHGLGCGSSGGQASIAVAHEMTIPIDSMNHLGRTNENHSLGDFVPGAPSYTLTKAHSHAVAHPIAFQLAGDRDNPSVSVSEDRAFCIPANPMSDRGQAVAHPMVLMDQGGGVMNVQTDGTTGTLRRETHGHEPVVMAPTLTASNDPSRSPQSTEVTNQVAAVHSVSMAVRRLTPMECERLQGFPDGYTNIPWRKAEQAPDGPRYKALGNSWAVPVVRWIGERIEANLKENK